MKVVVSLRWIALTLLVPTLTGCMALALAPSVLVGAGLVNGTTENAAKVTVDEQSISPELRAAFSTARTLAIVAGDRTSIKAADMFETKGGYVVTIDRPTAKNGEMTGSERRDALRRLCTTSHPDIAMLGRVTKTDSNNTVVAAFSGRSKTKNDWIMEVLVCRSSAAFAFSGTAEYDVGIYNAKQAELEELIGAEIGSKVVDALGKANTSAVAIQERSTTNAAAASASATTANSVNPTATTQTFGKTTPLAQKQAAKPAKPSGSATSAPITKVSEKSAAKEL